MPDRDELRDELNWVTEKISSQIWILNIGTLGTTWTLIISPPSQLKFTFAEASWILILCLFGLMSDLLQYLSAYKLIHQTRDRLKASGAKTIEYDDKSWLYGSRKFFFRAKVCFTLVASVWLLTVIFWKLT
jgi:hypothetical protein